MTLARKRRLVDLSVTLDNNPYTDPPPLLPKIDYMDHQQGWPEMAAMFPGLSLDQMPGHESWAAERLSITTHSGTHMDAPWHYASTTDGGKPAFGIDELPLEWCLQAGVKLDFRHLPDGHVVTAQQVAGELARIGHELQPLDIVLVNTRAGALFGQPGWYKGIMTSREQKMNVVDTAQWVMPGQHLEIDEYKYLIMLGESPWGLACHQLKGTELLHRDQVKWRHQEGKRPWLAGMVKEKMCALLHVRELLVLLGRGVNIEGR